MPTTHQIRTRLRQGVQELSMRGLKRGAAWAAELLNGLGDTNTQFQTMDQKLGAKAKSKGDQFFEDDDVLWPEQQSNDTDLVLVAKTFFDLGEYQRCAGVLSPT